MNRTGRQIVFRYERGQREQMTPRRALANAVFMAEEYLSEAIEAGNGEFAMDCRETVQILRELILKLLERDIMCEKVDFASMSDEEIASWRDSRYDDIQKADNELAARIRQRKAVLQNKLVMENEARRQRVEAERQRQQAEYEATQPPPRRTLSPDEARKAHRERLRRELGEATYQKFYGGE